MIKIQFEFSFIFVFKTYVLDDMVQRIKLNSIFKRNNINIETLPLSIKLSQNCFQILLTVRKGGTAKKSLAVELAIEPEQLNSGYVFIVDYKLVIGNYVQLVQKDRWSVKETLLNTEIEHNSSYVNVIELFFTVRETLVLQDISVATSFRNFKVLTSGRSFFVNTEQLNRLGGKMFKEWYEREAQGEESVVVQSLDINELEELLMSCCSSVPIVHRRNFYSLLEIAEKEKIVGLMRTLESYIIENDCIHPIRKLEFATEYRMTRLANTVLRSYRTQADRLDSLFTYLAENGESLAEVHLDVLKMLNIYDDRVIF